MTGCGGHPWRGGALQMWVTPPHLFLALGLRARAPSALEVQHGTIPTTFRDDPPGSRRLARRRRWRRRGGVGWLPRRAVEVARRTRARGGDLDRAVRRRTRDGQDRRRRDDPPVSGAARLYGAAAQALRVGFGMGRLRDGAPDGLARRRR